MPPMMIRSRTGYHHDVHRRADPGRGKGFRSDLLPVVHHRQAQQAAEVQQAAIDRAHYFYSLSPADRRAYSEQMATNCADPMTWVWHNWAKIFFNNKGVAAIETDNCANYPPDDAAVWDG
jgi:Domain of unknown function (DUF5078)